jgi:hypothetical protein
LKGGTVTVGALLLAWNRRYILVTRIFNIQTKWQLKFSGMLHRVDG